MGNLFYVSFKYNIPKVLSESLTGFMLKVIGPYGFIITDLFKTEIQTTTSRKERNNFNHSNIYFCCGNATCFLIRKDLTQSYENLFMYKKINCNVNLE